MKFKPALYDGTDPLYAPGLVWSKGHAFWKPTNKYLKAGYSITSIPLQLPGSKDDELQPERARLCRQYTREMLDWWEKKDESDIKFGTWAYLFARYRTDEFSPIHDVKANTREGYLHHIKRWENAIGHMKITALNYQTVRQIEKAMKEKGRTASNIHRMFTILRIVTKYAGFALGIQDAKDVSTTLSNMRFQSAPQRSVAPTREQVYAIVAAADEAGAKGFAAGLVLQYEFMLRAVDVRGQWLKDDGAGGIVRNGKRWQDGLTWDMFEPDLSGFTKVISKTARSMPAPYDFDLTELPELRDRLKAIRPTPAVGPVIVSERFRQPYDRHAWANAFRKFRAAAGVPVEVKNMDLRAGGVTEAKTMGADQMALRDAAQHTQASTTDRYVRGRSVAANKVVQLRQKGK